MVYFFRCCFVFCDLSESLTVWLVYLFNVYSFHVFISLLGLFVVGYYFYDAATNLLRYIYKIQKHLLSTNLCEVWLVAN